MFQSVSSSSYFWKPWPTNFIFGTSYIFRIRRSRSCMGSRPWSYDRNKFYIEAWSVFDWKQSVWLWLHAVNQSLFLFHMQHVEAQVHHNKPHKSYMSSAVFSSAAWAIHISWSECCLRACVCVCVCVCVWILTSVAQIVSTAQRLAILGAHT